MKNTLRYIFATLAASVALSTAISAQVVAKKTATNNYDGTYTLTMEAYATGSESVVVTDNKTPIDAVLVLDCSGSMAYNMTTDTYSASSYTISSILKDDLYNRTTYYILWSDGNYYPVSVSVFGTRTATFTVNGTDYGIQYIGRTFSTPNGYESVPNRSATLYTVTSTPTGTTRMEALQDACKIFINNMKSDQEKWNTDHPDKSIEHRVSIVTFASSSSTKVTLANGGVVEKYSTLISTINGLNANGATRADLGMEKAKEQITSARDSASKLVLFFTDGTPTSKNQFESQVASDAINYSYSIKSNGASVFALTVINWTSGSNEDKFLNYISSNYPTATSMNVIGTKASDGFYSIATDQEQLSKAFDSISSSAISGGTSATIDASSEIRDVVSESFMLPAGAENTAIEIYTDDFKEIQSGVYIFNNDLQKSDLVPEIDGKKITVTGFDYKANYCGYRIKRDSNGNIIYETDGKTPQTEAGGKKLVLVVTIVPDPDAESTGSASTNDDSKSGIYTSDGTPVVNFVTVPSTVYTNADMTVTISGLEDSDTAIFTIKANTKLNLYGTLEDFERKIVLTKDNPSAVIKSPVTYKDGDTVKFVTYTVTPENWSWAYTITPDSSTESAEHISGNSISKELVKILDDESRKEDIFFNFVAKHKTGTVINGETSKENDFQFRDDTN